MKGLVFDIKRNAGEDGPGIRTTVFFKGCPLRCAWCHNPEGIGREPALLVRHAACCAAECAAPCVRRCPQGALSVHAARLAHNAARCDLCGRCIAACERGALARVGAWMTVEEIVQRVRIDRPFFDATGGGVTLSGGEPTLQTAFAGALLQALKREGIATAIETCGAFNYARFARRLLPWLDHIYYDLKLMDAAAHRRWTGVPNHGILANLARLQRAAGSRLQVRVPLIPEVTETEQNLAALGRHLKALGIETVELLPYNPLWTDKAPQPGSGAVLGRHGFMSAAAQQRAARWVCAG